MSDLGTLGYDAGHDARDGGARDHGRAAAGPIPFGRLLLVEARKMVDTRGAKVLIAILAALTVAAIGGRGTIVGPELHRLFTTAAVGYGTLLPAIAILAVTGEWTHRSVMTTFTLEPRRGRVLAARCLPPLLATLVAVLFALAVAVVATVVTAQVQGVPAEWNLAPLTLLGWTAANVLTIAMALAFGMLLVNPAAAITCFFVFGTLWTMAGNLNETARAVAEWVDLSTALGPLSAGDMTWYDAARLATATVCCVVIPMAVGVVRALRAEVR
jgi:hypothetical protein